MSQKVPHRETRKIQDLQKTKNILKNKSFTKKYKPDEEKKDKLKLLEKDDNIAIESKVVETVVKPPKVSRDPPKTAYSVKPVPKFIIKQAGPSQTFGWVGPGSYAPLNIPNIFKSIGLDTSWNPDENSVYPVKLTYPAPTEKPKKTVVTSKPTKPSVKYTTTTSAPKVKEAPIPVYKPSNNIYKQPVTSKPFTNYKTGELETLYYGTEKVQPYTTTTKKPVVTTTQSTTTTTTTAAPSTTRYTFVYNTYKPSTKPPQQYHPAPTFYPNPPQTYFNSAPTYKPVAISTASPYHYSSPVPSYASSPHYNPIVSSPAPPAYPSSTPPPAAYFSSPTYAPVAFSSPAPYFPAYSTPAPYSPAYSTPAPYASSPHYSPVTSPAPSYNSPSYQPSSAFSQPIKPFTAFNIPAAPKVAEAPIDKSDSGPSLKNTVDLRSGSSPPVVGIIETENKNNPADDGEVFYIFYENEDLAQDSIESGLSLQRFIQEDFGEGKDNLFSESISEEIININNDQQKFPNFGLIEEVGKPEVQQPLFYDVPIKIEETNPGDDVRTIYVPIENAINVPDNFEVINISPTDVDSPFAVGSNQAQVTYLSDIMYS